MKKRIFFILVLIIILSFSLILLREYIINYDKIYDYSTKLSRENVIDLLNNGTNYDNYYRNVITEKGEEEFYYKNGILTNYINERLNYYINISEDSKEMIIIEDEENKIASIVEDFQQVNFPMETTQLGYYSVIYDTENFKFNFKGVMKFNNRDTYVVETKSEDDLFSSLIIKYYIDKETGVIVKRTEISKFIFITKKMKQYDRGIKFDIVKDEDVKKPDLSEYEIIPITFPALIIY
ncbi:MAG: hypothetical protein J6J60_00215 [Clostridia bacterium]|nr:hypothetical protein [Clostridia bacterium]